MGKEGMWCRYMIGVSCSSQNCYTMFVARRCVVCGKRMKLFEVPAAMLKSTDAVAEVALRSIGSFSDTPTALTRCRLLLLS